MSYCLNPKCKAPENSVADACASCGTILHLNGHYEALRPIGQGGFGRTFLAVDRSNSLKPRCVIKQLYPQQIGVEGKASDLFRQEAEQLSRLGHYPSIPTFLDYFEQDGFQYLIQEFIEGQNLAEISAAGTLFGEADTLALLETLLETLDFLHYRNIIHRDVKPANIIETTNGRFVLVDLGAAKLMTGTAIALTGTVIGSAEYVAPEQLRGKAIFASDLYSLGATCITMLTGMSPFTLFDTSTGRWEWRDYLNIPVGDRLGDLIDGLLEGPTKLRYASADEVLRDLDVILGRDVEPESWQREEDDRFDDWPADPWNQVEDDRFSKLDVSFEKSGEVAERRKKGDRENARQPLKFMAAIVGVSSLIWIFQSWANSRTVEAPDPAAPFIQPLFPPQQEPRRDMSSVPISKIIEPAYSRPIKPFKVIKNIQPFQAMALKDGGKTIVTGFLNSGEIRLDFISASTGETSSTLKLNNPSFKNSQAPSLYKIYATQDSIFAYYNGAQSLNLLKINIKDQSQSLMFPSSSSQIIPISNGKLLNRWNYTSNSTEIWEITDDGNLKNKKSLNIANNTPFSTSYILSSDQNRIFGWSISESSPYKVSILSADGKTVENQMAMPFSTPKNTMVQYVNLFSPQSNGEDYLVVQLGG